MPRETIGQAYVKVHADGEGFDAELREQLRSSEPTMEEGGKKHGKAFNRGLKSSEREREGYFTRLKARLRNVWKDSEKVGDRIGRLFGKGKRNDFLNVIGGMVGSLGTLGAAITKLILGPFTEFPRRVKELRDQSEGLFSAIGTAAAEGLPGIIIAVAAVVAGAEALTLALGPLGSAVSLLVGLILALAGSLGFALAGALVAVGGALVPFAAAIGVFALAVSSPNIGKALKGLKDDLADLGNMAAQNIFGKHGEGAKALGSVLSAVKPIVDSVSSALGGLVQWLGEVARSKGFQTMMQNIATAIGPMVTQIGQIAGNLGLFLARAFLIAEPYINQFLGWLDKVTQAMADSGKGGKKSPLAQFFKDAWESAKIVGSLIWQIIGLIGDLLSAGKGTGDNIFVSLTGEVKKLRDWLSDPANSKQLQQWFDDAGKLAGKIGEIISDVLELVAALDTPTNRTILFYALDAADWLIDKLVEVVSAVDDVNEALFHPGAPATNPAQEVVNSILTAFQNLPGQIAGFFSGLWASISGFFAPIPGQIASFFVGLGQKIWTAAGNLATGFATWVSGLWGQLTSTIAQIISFFIGLPGKIWAAAGDISAAIRQWLAGLPVAIIEFIGKIIVGFIGLTGKIITAAGNIIGAFTQWLANLPGIALQTAVNVTVAFINLSIKIIRAAGSLASQFGTWVASVPGKARKLAVDIWHGFIGLAARMIQAAGSIAARFGSWVASIPGKARSIAISAINGFRNLAGRIISAAGSLISRFGSWVASLPGKAKSIANQIANAFSGLASKAIAKAGSLVAKVQSWASGVYGAAKGVANDIVSAFSGLAGRIVAAIGTIVPRISMPHINVPKINLGASGFVTNGPRLSVIGEAGPEAVVPLRRPLSQVDPAVRALSAIAQNKRMAAGGVVDRGRTIDVGGITINTPAEDPRAVASEVVAHMAAAAYI